MHRFTTRTTIACVRTFIRCRTQPEQRRIATPHWIPVVYGLSSPRLQVNRTARVLVITGRRGVYSRAAHIRRRTSSHGGGCPRHRVRASGPVPPRNWFMRIIIFIWFFFSLLAPSEATGNPDHNFIHVQCYVFVCTLYVKYLLPTTPARRYSILYGGFEMVLDWAGVCVCGFVVREGRSAIAQRRRVRRENRGSSFLSATIAQS